MLQQFLSYRGRTTSTTTSSSSSHYCTVAVATAGSASLFCFVLHLLPPDCTVAVATAGCADLLVCCVAVSATGLHGSRCYCRWCRFTAFSIVLPAENCRQQRCAAGSCRSSDWSRRRERCRQEYSRRRCWTCRVVAVSGPEPWGIRPRGRRCRSVSAVEHQGTGRPQVTRVAACEGPSQVSACLRPLPEAAGGRISISDQRSAISDSDQRSTVSVWQWSQARQGFGGEFSQPWSDTAISTWIGSLFW